MVRAAGGTVIRPNLVYGRGDIFTLTTLLGGMSQFDAWIGNPDALVSAIDATDLGRLVAALTTAPDLPDVLHAAYPAPIKVRELIEPAYARVGIRPPSSSIPVEYAAARVKTRGISVRQIAMIASDNWYQSNQIWAITHTVPVQPPPINEDATAYYAEQLRAFSAAKTPAAT